MQQRDEGGGVPEPIPGQLSIDVPTSPGAVGRWTPDEQFRAYARQFGKTKAQEQKKQAEEAQACNCGVQEAENKKAREEERRAKKLSGHLHKAGCPQQRSLGTRSTPRISSDEQIRRYTSTEGDE